MDCHRCCTLPSPHPIHNQLTILQGSFTTLSTALIIASQTSQRMKITPYLLLPVEFLAMLATAASFGATLSLTMKLTGLSMGPPSLDPSSSPDLSTFAMLVPLSKGYAIAAGTTLFALLTTSLSALIQTCHRARDSKACSFEPTASALGMSHGYQAVAPRTSRGPVPTLYDPLKPMPREEGAGDEEKGFAARGAEMGRRDSVVPKTSLESEGTGITGPLGLEAPAKVAQMRPARPWSEMPKRK